MQSGKVPSALFTISIRITANLNIKERVEMGKLRDPFQQGNLPKTTTTFFLAGLPTPHGTHISLEENFDLWLSEVLILYLNELF